MEQTVKGASSLDVLMITLDHSRDRDWKIQTIVQRVQYFYVQEASWNDCLPRLPTSVHKQALASMFDSDVHTPTHTQCEMIMVMIRTCLT